MLVWPIYGWGWTTSEAGTPDLPAPFHVAISEAGDGTWSARIVEPGHLLDALACELSRRHAEDDRLVNIVVQLAGDERLYGYAELREG